MKPVPLEIKKHEIGLQGVTITGGNWDCEIVKFASIWVEPYSQ